MSENCGGLIIDPEELARIRAACQLRAAELERVEALRCSSEARGASQSVLDSVSDRVSDPALVSSPIPATETERFAPAFQTMPAPVRAFFERDESPYVPVHRRESVEDREERQLRESFGGWGG
jgi:hypothetical protein